MPPLGHKEITLEQHLGKLREQAAKCEPGPLKDLILKYVRTVQDLIDQQVPQAPLVKEEVLMSEKDAVKATDDVLAKFRLKK